DGNARSATSDQVAPECVIVGGSCSAPDDAFAEQCSRYRRPAVSATSGIVSCGGREEPSPAPPTYEKVTATGQPQGVTSANSTSKAGTSTVPPDTNACESQVVTTSNVSPSSRATCVAVPSASISMPDWAATVTLRPLTSPSPLLKSPEVSSADARATASMPA